MSDRIMHVGNILDHHTGVPATLPAGTSVRFVAADGAYIEVSWSTLLQAVEVRGGGDAATIYVQPGAFNQVFIRQRERGE